MLLYKRGVLPIDEIWLVQLWLNSTVSSLGGENFWWTLWWTIRTGSGSDGACVLTIQLVAIECNLWWKPLGFNCILWWTSKFRTLHLSLVRLWSPLAVCLPRRKQEKLRNSKISSPSVRVREFRSSSKKVRKSLSISSKSFLSLFVCPVWTGRTTRCFPSSACPTFVDRWKYPYRFSAGFPLLRKIVTFWSRTSLWLRSSCRTIFLTLLELSLWQAWRFSSARFSTLRRFCSGLSMVRLSASTWKLFLRRSGSSCASIRSKPSNSIGPSIWRAFIFFFSH